MNIIILSDQNKFSQNFHDFYPFYKWNKLFQKDGIFFKIIYDQNQLVNYEYDFAIISNRVKFENRNAFIDFLLKLKRNIPKVLLFDASDTSGIVDFDLLPYVDGIIKKQVLKNKEFYLQNNYDLSVRPWLNKMPKNPNYLNYVQAKIDDLNKIIVGWNIGMCDYRNLNYFPGYLRNYFPSNLKTKKFDSLINSKKILTSFRGETSYGNPEISYQRNGILNYLKTNKIDNIITGSRVNKSHYLNEMQESKITLSPFGWGEVCYRDFEAMFSASLLIKPSMNHINTFPNFFIENETYVAINWDLSNLDEKFKDVVSNYDDYKTISINAFEKFHFYQNSFIEFKLFFLDCLEQI